MAYKDDFSDPQRGGILGIMDAIGPKAGFFVVLIALSFLVGVVWNLYSSNDSDSVRGEVPVVRADNKPFKAIPDDPGGQDIAHRDSTIFSSLRGEKANDTGRIENLFDDEEEEEPLPRSQLFAGLSTDENDPDRDIDALSEASAEPSPLDQPFEEKPEPEITEEVAEEAVAAAPAEEPKEILEIAPNEEDDADIANQTEEIVQEALNVLPTISVKPSAKPKPPVKKAVVKKAPAPKVVPKKAAPDLSKIVAKTAENAPQKLIPTPMTSGSGNYYVQVGSVKSAASTQAEWNKYKSKYGVLAGLGYRVESADLGAKGVFHRIQAGPVTKARATSICNSIKRVTPGGCLIKKR